MQKQFKLHKDYLIKELAKLERLNWAENDDVADSIFPYVIIETINLLKNSEVVESPIDYAPNGEEAQKMLEEILAVQ